MRNQDSYLYLILLFFLFFFINLKSNNNFVNKLLQNKILIFLGSISYGIYMTHYFVIWTLRQIFRFIVRVDTVILENNFIQLKLNVIQNYIILFLTTLFTILISYLSKVYVENKFKNLTKNINF